MIDYINKIKDGEILITTCLIPVIKWGKVYTKFLVYMKGHTQAIKPPETWSLADKILLTLHDKHKHLFLVAYPVEKILLHPEQSLKLIKQRINYKLEKWKQLFHKK